MSLVDIVPVNRRDVERWLLTKMHKQPNMQSDASYQQTAEQAHKT